MQCIRSPCKKWQFTGLSPSKSKVCFSSQHLTSFTQVYDRRKRFIDGKHVKLTNVANDNFFDTCGESPPGVSKLLGLSSKFSKCYA